MKRPLALWLIPAAAALLLLVSASASAQAPIAPTLASAPGAGGAVFTMSNAVAGNTVLAYEIGPESALIPAGHFGTRGTGTGSSLADQGALALTSDHRYLLVVNAGDNSVTVFAVHAPSPVQPILSFVDRVASRGVEPISLTVHDQFVYVLNAGSPTVPGNIAGFLLADHGLLLPLPGARQPLSTSTPVGPAEVSFNPAGTVLVVTEETTSLIDTYPVNFRGIAQAPVVTASNGSTPYGFAFSHGGSLIVSDAAIGALSSYSVVRDGTLTVVSGSIPDGQAAPCWVVVSGSYAFTSNAHGATITSYQIGAGGSLSVAVDVAATTGAADTDLALGGSHGQYLEVYDAGAAELQEFRIGAGGTLTPLYAVFSLPPAAEGLAAF
ncbi:MAG: lactonase family protein [Thermoplasmata archaeon]